MKAISLLQPWASLVVDGHKLIETRSFGTKYRGELLIHVSLGKKYGKLSCRELCYTEPFNSIIGSGKGFDQLPFGAIIGKVDLIDVIPTFEVTEPGTTKIFKGEQVWSITKQEIAFGDYGPNRYAWLLANPVKFAKPIPAKGKLSIWDFDMPDHIHMALANGHARFPSPPDQETVDAVNNMAQRAFKSLKKSSNL